MDRRNHFKYTESKYMAMNVEKNKFWRKISFGEKYAHV